MAGSTDNPKTRIYTSREYIALVRKASESGYPLDNEYIVRYLTLWQLDEMVTFGRYDA